MSMGSDGNIKKVLVMGVGNTLMQDDGVGIHIVESLRQSPDSHPALHLVDGGTIGLALLPEIEDSDAVIVVDASELGAPPGTLRVFRNSEIDGQLSGKQRTVHEVALLDLFSAAAIRGRMPAQRALIAVQPECTDWGDGCTPTVLAAAAEACVAVNRLAGEWCTGEEAA
jgi:hydrogenase maturation protease